MVGLDVVWVVPQKLCLDIHPGETMAMDRELCGFILAQIDPDGHAVETPFAFLQLPETLQVLVTDLDHLGQLAQGAL